MTLPDVEHELLICPSNFEAAAMKFNIWPTGPLFLVFQVTPIKFESYIFATKKKLLHVINLTSTYFNYYQTMTRKFGANTYNCF